MIKESERKEETFHIKIILRNQKVMPLVFLGLGKTKEV
jgi:uncharacterized protein YjfI (DUF2170 family)